jgi:hypothetical protein
VPVKVFVQELQPARFAASFRLDNANQGIIMKNRIATYLIATYSILTGTSLPFHAQAQSEASALSAVSAMPVASVVVGASAAATAVLAVPVVLSTTGAVLVVKAVEVSARGTVYLLERASDGAAASVEIVGKGVAGVSVGAGTLVTVGVIGSGVILSAAGEVVAFIPNALGRALLHNERVTQ